MRKIGYWGTTAIVSAMMLMSAVKLLTSSPEMTASLAHLGYPPYFMPFLGTAKLLGVAALLYTGLPRVKEWAYAGFTFTFLGAAWSHFGSGDGFGKVIPPLVVLALLSASYALRERETKG